MLIDQFYGLLMMLLITKNLPCNYHKEQNILINVTMNLLKERNHLIIK